MDILQSIVSFLQKKNTPEALKSPEGICPNCWGRDEYAGQFYDRIKQENLDINSTDATVGWITAYANKNFAGLVMKRSTDKEALACEKCKVSFKQSD